MVLPYAPDTTPPSTDFTVSGLLFSDSVTSITLSSTGYVNTATVAGSPYTVTPSAAVGTGLGNYSDQLRHWVADGEHSAADDHGYQCQ